VLSVIGAAAAACLGVQSPALADTTSSGAHTPHIMPAIGSIQPPPVDVCQQLPACPPGAAAGQPQPVNMAYFGGHVQVRPRIYLVFWGWGQSGAFDHTTAGRPASDPDGAAAKMTAFIKAIGGTTWAGVQTQYYQTNADGTKTFITNPANQFGGAWYDNTNPIHNNVTGLELAQEASRAVTHFGVRDLNNTQFVIAQPQKFNEAGFNSGAGYCAWHDYTKQQFYPGVREGISFTNMPYVLNMGGSCGQDLVNPAPGGNLDGVTIVLGHEVEETVTDPGAEDYINGVQYGGWFDWQGWENGDKCAWVGDGIGSVPGAAFNTGGNDGQLYPVQTLWSNNSLQGAGYCAPKSGI
jgi:serine protease